MASDKITRDDLLNVLKEGVRSWNDFRKTVLLDKNPWLEGIRVGYTITPGDPDPRDLEYINFKDACLASSRFCEVSLSHADLRNAILESTMFHKSYFINTNCQNAIFTEANLYKSLLSSADLTNAKLNLCKLESVDFQNAKLCGADLSRTFLFKTDFTNADLRGADFTGALMLETNFTNANLEGANVYGVSCWDVCLDGANQNDLSITSNGKTITVDDIEVAQFIYLLYDNPKIRNIISIMGKKSVLILGRFTKERKIVLDAIRDKLRSFDFVPILFDFEGAKEKDFTETIKILAGLSRFVIVDITNPKSSPLELQATIPDYMIPFVPIIERGEKPFSMFSDLQNKYSWVSDVIDYPSLDLLMNKFEVILKKAIQIEDQLKINKHKGETRTTRLEDL